MVRLRLVGSDHAVCRFIKQHDTAKTMRLPPGAFRFRRYYGLQWEAAGAVVATDSGRLIGFFRFDRRPNSSILQAIGTWVDPEYRRIGLARRMWRRAVHHTKVSRITVYTATRAGSALVRALADDRRLSHQLRAYSWVDR